MDISRFLPNEVLGIIADHLVSEVDLFHLGQTNRLFSQIAILRLYRLNAKYNQKDGIIYQASRQGRVDILHRAAQSGVYLGDFSLARTAASYGYTKVLDFIVTSRGKESFDARQLSTLAEDAGSCGMFDMLSHLFDHFGASLNPEALSNCLLYATRRNGKECVRLLLDKGADPLADTWSETPLAAALRLGNSDILNIMLEKGANVHQQITTWNTPIAMHIAAIDGNISILEVLLKYGADASVGMTNGRTPLQLAICNEKIAAACFLIQKTTNHGASIRTLFSAMRHGASITLAVLHLKAGVGRAGLINTRDYAGRTVLFIAAREGKLKIVQQCLAHGADTGIADHFGTTPIFAAARNGHVDVVRQLLDADPGLIESTDSVYGSHSLLYWARRSGNRNLVDLLRRAIELAGLEDPKDARRQSTRSKNAHKRRWKRACDVCARRLLVGDVMQCVACHHGDFFTCLECYSHAKCLDASHEEWQWTHRRGCDARKDCWCHSPSEVE